MNHPFHLPPSQLPASSAGAESSPAPPAVPGTIRYFVGLGSNLGQRFSTLNQALIELAALPAVDGLRASSAFETRPVGPGTGPFLNAVAELEARLGPPELLRELLAIERHHGRVRRRRWGDRTLDLDILLAQGHEGLVHLAEPDLTLPHPRMLGRDFVLAPLAELAPELALDGQTCAERLDAIPVGERTILGRIDAEPWTGSFAKLPSPGG